MQKINRQYIDHLVESIKIIEFMESEYSSDFIFNNKSEWANTNCPLPDHEDSNPSFGINQESNIYNCFGCGSTGDIIKLVQSVEGLNFVEAIQRLSNYANIEIELVNLDVKYLIRELSQSMTKYFEKENKSNFPGGMSENSFMIAFAERTKKYLKNKNYNSYELDWIESIYKNIEDSISKQDYKEINNVWKNFGKMSKERK